VREEVEAGFKIEFRPKKVNAGRGKPSSEETLNLYLPVRNFFDYGYNSVFCFISV
jgi:hypothetical protein